MARWQGCIKVLMCVFNVIFLAVGIALAAIGGILYVKYNDFFSYADNGFANIAFFAIFIGAGVAIISFTGLCGAFCKSRCLLMVYSTLLTLILFGMIAIAVFGFVYRKKVDNITAKAMKNAIKTYDTPVGVTLDWAQQNLKCCGISGPRDYATSNSKLKCSNATISSIHTGISTTVSPVTSGNGTDIGGVPTCYDDSTCLGTLFTDGCQKKFLDYVEGNLVLVGGVVAGVVVLQLICIIFSCILIKTIDD